MSTFIDRAKTTCALGGALSTLLALPRAIPIVHSSGGCASTLSNAFNLASGYRGAGYCGGTMTPTSNIVEKNIVFGGEERLEEQIINTVKIVDGDLYFVITGCQVEIIGDDAVSVARRFKGQNPPVLAASTPGFAGNSFAGYDTVLTTLATEFIEQKSVKAPKTVNLLGIVPGQDVFFRGNLREIARLLGLLGIQANTFFGDEASIEKIRNYGDASLTVVFSESYGINAAKAFEETHQIPYITADLPIGPTRSEAFLRQIGRRLELAEDTVEAVISSEKRYFFSYFERVLDAYTDLDFQRYAIVNTDTSYAFPLTSFLADDLGWIPHLVVINDLIEDDLRKKEYANKVKQLESETKPKVIFEQHAGQLLKHVRTSWPFNQNNKYYNSLTPSYLIASSLEGDVAQKLGTSFLPVAFPVTNRVILDKGYTGFKGGLTLAEDLLSALVSNR